MLLCNISRERKKHKNELNFSKRPTSLERDINNYYYALEEEKHMLKKRIISIILCALMFFAITTPAFANEVTIPLDNEFMDSHTYEGMNSLHERIVEPQALLPQVEYAEGFDDAMNTVIETFNLTSTTTRGRAAAYIVMAREPALLNGAVASNRFDDVPMNSWYFPAVSWAANRQWILGLAGTNRFNPNANVTRQEFAVMLVRTFNAPLNSGTQLDRFSDRNQIASWAVPYVRRAVQLGWIQGFPDGTFRPTNNITRQDAITMTNRTPGRNISDPTVRTITWNQNGGTNVVNWERAQGHAIGIVPTTTRASVNSSRWFNTTSITGGTQTTATTVMPNANTTYTLRWYDSMRHDTQWHHSTTLRMREPTWGPTIIHAGVRNGMNNWNSRNTPVSFAFNSTSNNMIFTANLGANAPWGVIDMAVSGRNVVQFDIFLNTSRLVASNTAVTNLTNSVASVMAHELGHAVGLRDNPIGIAHVGVGLITNSIMYINRNRNTLVVPTSFDVTSVNLLY